MILHLVRDQLRSQMVKKVTKLSRNSKAKCAMQCRMAENPIVYHAESKTRHYTRAHNFTE